MDSTHLIKFENSPVESVADSFASTPGSYPSLFDSNPAEAMTPQSFDDDSMFGGSMNGSTAGTPAPEKKPVKKRKSWGQQLPEPKTNLPPRKRAKTEDEKEQRRVERVLRNRRAAQSSRERKRQEVEALEEQKRAVERRNQDLEMRLADSEARYAALEAEMKRVTGGKMVVFHGSSRPSTPAQEFRAMTPPVTLSKDLFSGSHTGADLPVSSQSFSDPPTVNPSSLSPEVGPVTDFSSSFPDLAQLSAAELCGRQCQSGHLESRISEAISHLLTVNLLLTMMTSTACLTLINPLSQIFTSMRDGSPLSSTPSVLTTIIWLVTTTTLPMMLSSTTSSSTRTSNSRTKYSLRISLLKRLLACSPSLARPLMDATMEHMRQASQSKQLSTDCLSFAVQTTGREKSPSIATLMTLLWVTSRIDREQRLKTPKLDAATEVRQTCVDVSKELCRTPEEIRKGLSFVASQRKSQHRRDRSVDWERQNSRGRWR